MLEVSKRAKVRLAGEEVQPTDALLNEITKTAIDRLSLRLGVGELPDSFESIAVDVVVKMFRRQSFEGIASEGGAISTSFVDDILKEYDGEIQGYKDSDAKTSRKLRFL